MRAGHLTCLPGLATLPPVSHPPQESTGAACLPNQSGAARGEWMREWVGGWAGNCLCSVFLVCWAAKPAQTTGRWGCCPAIAWQQVFMPRHASACNLWWVNKVSSAPPQESFVPFNHGIQPLTWGCSLLLLQTETGCHECWDWYISMWKRQGFYILSSWVQHGVAVVSLHGCPHLVHQSFSLSLHMHPAKANSL